MRPQISISTNGSPTIYENRGTDGCPKKNFRENFFGIFAIFWTYKHYFTLKNFRNIDSKWVKMPTEQSKNGKLRGQGQGWVLLDSPRVSRGTVELHPHAALRAAHQSVMQEGWVLQ